MEANGVTVKEQVSASKKLGRTEAEEIARSADMVFVAKGKAVREFEELSDGLVDAMLGATGNLRAPLIRVGKTVVVGFNEEVYERLLG